MSRFVIPRYSHSYSCSILQRNHSNPRRMKRSVSDKTAVGIQDGNGDMSEIGTVRARKKRITQAQFACNYCNCKYSDKNWLDLHIKKHGNTHKLDCLCADCGYELIDSSLFSVSLAHSILMFLLHPGTRLQITFILSIWNNHNINIVQDPMVVCATDANVVRNISKHRKRGWRTRKVCTEREPYARYAINRFEWLRRCERIIGHIMNGKEKSKAYFVHFAVCIWHDFVLLFIDHDDFDCRHIIRGQK